MTTLERLERANPVADADRLLSSPGAMDDFILAVKERSGIVHTTEDRPPIEVPPEKEPGTPRSWRRRFVPVLVAAAAIIAAIVVAVVLLGGGDDPGPDVVDPVPTTSPAIVPESAVVPFAGTTKAGAGLLAVAFTDDEWLPFVDGREGSGFTIDVISEMARRIDLTVEPSPVIFDPGVPFEEVLSFGDVSAGGVVATDDKAALANFTSPFFRNRLAVVVNATATPGIVGIDDLAAGDLVSAGIPDGYLADTNEWTTSRLEGTGVELLNIWNHWDVLGFGGITAAIDSHVRALAVLANNPDLEIVEVIDAGLEFSFPVDPNNPELAAALDGALQGMISDGAYQEIYDRWFVDPEGSVAN